MPVYWDILYEKCKRKSHSSSCVEVPCNIPGLILAEDLCCSLSPHTFYTFPTVLSTRHKGQNLTFNQKSFVDENAYNSLYIYTFWMWAPIIWLCDQLWNHMESSWLSSGFEAIVLKKAPADLVPGSWCKWWGPPWSPQPQLLSDTQGYLYTHELSYAPGTQNGHNDKQMRACMQV